MGRKIERAAIGLGLDDSPCRLALGGAMHQDFADAFARHEQDRAGVKFARQFQRAHCTRRKHGNAGVRM